MPYYRAKDLEVLIKHIRATEIALNALSVAALKVARSDIKRFADTALLQINRQRKTVVLVASTPQDTNNNDEPTA